MMTEHQRCLNCCRWICGLPLTLLLLVGCATDTRREPAPRPSREAETRREVEAPPRERSSKPAVIALIDQADSLDRAGRQAEAAAQLDRALRLDPRDSRLLQRRAELFLAMDQPQQAENHALKSFQLSVKSGALCRRNWETVSYARRALGDRAGAGEALSQQQRC